MTKRGLTAVTDYRQRLLLVILADDICEVMIDVGVTPNMSAALNRHELLAHWDPMIEKAVLRKVEERLQPR